MLNVNARLLNEDLILMIEQNSVHIVELLTKIRSLFLASSFIWLDIPILFIYETIFLPAEHLSRKLLICPKCCISAKLITTLSCFTLTRQLWWSVHSLVEYSASHVAATQWRSHGGGEDEQSKDGRRLWAGGTQLLVPDKLVGVFDKLLPIRHITAIHSPRTAPKDEKMLCWWCQGSEVRPSESNTMAWGQQSKGQVCQAGQGVPNEVAGECPLTL